MQDYHQLMANTVTAHAKQLGRAIDYIEVGVFQGDSALAVMGSGHCRWATLIDNFSNTHCGDATSSLEIANGKLVWYNGNYEIKVGDSQTILPTVTRQFDVGFVDGDHTIDGCGSDMALMWPLIREDGIMFVDDLHNPGYMHIKGMVEQFAAEKGLKYTYHEVHEGLGGIAAMISPNKLGRSPFPAKASQWMLVGLRFVGPATGYSLSGPGSGAAGTPSTPFTVTLTPAGGTNSGTAITPSDGGGGGTFTPSILGVLTGSPSATFTYTAASAGTKTISCSNNGGLSNPGSISYVASAGAFDPSSVAGLKGWWKADALSLNDGDLLSGVGGWPDSSGGGNTLGGGGTFKTNIVNGKPVVRLNGTSEGLITNTDAIPSNYTVFAVVKAASISAGSHNITAFGGAGSIILLRRDAATLNDYHYTGSAFINVPEASAIVAGAWNSVTTNWDGANISMWRNGVLKGTSAATAIGSTGSNFSVGYDYGASGNYWDGDIAEVLIYNNAISTTDRQAVEGYLRTKYALP